MAPAARIIVVGGGLSGLSAAHTVYQAGGNVVVLDKQSFFGGNSTKATSGINAALTSTQTDNNIADSVKQFYDDALKSARDQARPDLIRVLTYQSASAVEWLQDVFGLDLTLVSRLGGHSQPRTHRGHDAKFPGMAITYALMQRLEDLAEREPERVQILKKARATSITKDENDITGVTYEAEGGTSHHMAGPVIIATGGYAADFSGDKSLLKMHRPDTYGLATTNGSHATGDGQKMILEIGGNGIDMDKVQVHPTGLVDPKDPGSKWKFHAAEALRAEGGILLNADGDRFCDELGHRDYVSGMIWEEKKRGKFPIWLVLNSKASSTLDFHTRHYSGRGLMKRMSGHELAREICYTFHVAVMEPVLHFTMGGVEINAKAQVLNHSGTPFNGLYACSEVAGGVHGTNRLGGSSLLGCVVYGRVAGDSASNYLNRYRMDDIPGTTGTPKSSLAKKEFKIPDIEYTIEEVARHNTKEDLWVIVEGVVMDLSDWLDEHPGGPQALMNFMGHDATEEFEMLHDDEVTPKYSPKQVIGRVKGVEPTLDF
ncbi:FAD binding domain-containing protein [Aspergillus germanicus]